MSENGYNYREIMEFTTKARQLLDNVYYWAEGSDDPVVREIERLMTWADSSIMEAEQQIRIHFGEV